MKANSVLETIGRTPHIRLSRMFPGAEVWVKSERSNPGGSIKDRIGLAMVEAAEADGRLKPGGEAMTESAAMVLYLDDLAPAAGLLPARGDPRRPRALNQLVVLVGAIYPTVTFSDPPEDWTLPGPPAERLGQLLGERKQRLWQSFEAAVPATPFLSGEAPGALDLYVATMLHWRPGPAWFAANTPKLAAIAQRVAAEPRLQPIMARHFTDPA